MQNKLYSPTSPPRQKSLRGRQDWRWTQTMVPAPRGLRFSVGKCGTFETASMGHSEASTALATPSALQNKQRSSQSTEWPPEPALGREDRLVLTLVAMALSSLDAGTADLDIDRQAPLPLPQPIPTGAALAKSLKSDFMDDIKVSKETRYWLQELLPVEARGGSSIQMSAAASYQPHPGKTGIDPESQSQVLVEQLTFHSRLKCASLLPAKNTQTS
ncbi:hypothetical protein MJG53_000978 [Ovis ammon polii x Ovis aries]|uniref:Uncharacterized protein n=1 Tax=Ovis ammon polii x Ovis aries TaxID=2918886 RepID=A0ACB9VK63_9CETA|nr:hypothetical protein MJT46_000471 [Ovis ammon polii x Ovis aries]KAI4589929.1 hypothetical protein MJG53_000978 [Ovis ammon polii x Ovis aries]